MAQKKETAYPATFMSRTLPGSVRCVNQFAERRPEGNGRVFSGEAKLAAERRLLD
jgi:hypothetical protein